MAAAVILEQLILVIVADRPRILWSRKDYQVEHLHRRTIDLGSNSNQLEKARRVCVIRNRASVPAL